MTYHKATRSKDFQEQLDKASGLVVVYFSSAGCESCASIDVTEGSDMLNANEGVLFLEADMDEECVDSAAENEIDGPPTFLIYKDEQVVERFQGNNLEELQNSIDPHK